RFRVRACQSDRLERLFDRSSDCVPDALAGASSRWHRRRYPARRALVHRRQARGPGLAPVSALLRRAPVCALAAVLMGVALAARANAQSSTSPVAAIVLENRCAAELQSAGDSVVRPLG